MWKKLASIAALLSSAAALNACQTSAGKPVNCLPAFEMKGRCAKVPPITKRTGDMPAPASKAKAKKKTVATSTFVPAWAQPSIGAPSRVPSKPRDTGYAPIPGD